MQTYYTARADAGQAVNVHDYPSPPWQMQVDRYEPCPWCQRAYDGGGMKIDGEVVCRRCAERYLRDNYSIDEIAEALGYPWVQAD